MAAPCPRNFRVLLVADVVVASALAVPGMTCTVLDAPETLTGLNVEGFGMVGQHGDPYRRCPACLDLDTVGHDGGNSHGGPGEQATLDSGGTALDAS